MIHALNAIPWLWHFKALIFYFCVCIYEDLPTQGIYSTVLACSLRAWFSPRCFALLSLHCSVEGSEQPFRFFVSSLI